MGNKHYWVYMHINKKNGKRYVGITAQDTPEMRWGKNGRGYLNGHHSKFANAIKKHGWDNFDHIVAEVDSREQMLFMESFLILLWNSVKKGYNSTYGGENGALSEELVLAMSKVVCQYDKFGKFIREWDSIASVQRELGYSAGHIVSCCQGTRISVGNFIWRYKEDTNGLDIEAPIIRGNKPVCQYTKDGIFIKEWYGAKEAGLALDIPPTSITACCMRKKGHKSAGEYIWRYKGDAYEAEIEVEPHGLCKPVVQLDINGNFIRKWICAFEVTKVLGWTSQSITSCCKHKPRYNTAYKYRWMFLDEYLANGGVIA